MNAVFLRGTRVPLDPTQAIGKGGEADVYIVGARALKVYKTPDHPNFRDDPYGQRAAAGVVREVTVVRGAVTATRVFRTEGLIVYADAQEGELRWLTHERGGFYREDGSLVAQGSLHPGMRFRLRGKETLLGQADRFVVLAPGQAPRAVAVDNFGTLPQFATNPRFTYWLRNGQLRRTAPLGGMTSPPARGAAGEAGGLGREPAMPLAEVYVGDVLARQTLFWAGPEFGFGFYRAGGLSVAFVFDAEKPGINDRVALPPLRGQLIDSTCVFGRGRCWFFAATRDAGRTRHTCALIRPDGSVTAVTEAEAEDGSWLGHLRGKCAVGDFLLAATDDGVVRVEVDAGQIRVVKAFPDTEEFVDSRSHLFPGPRGLYVVGPHEIQLLKIA
jgi:hypothetical protein